MATATTTKAPIKTEAAFRQVIDYAEQIRNDDAHTVATMSPGDMWVQGDIGLVCLAALPKGCVVDNRPTPQLAPGTTQGSRHCVAAGDMARVRFYRLIEATPLDGPVIEAPDGLTIEHPEHGDVTLPPGIYGVVYQRQFAKELKRVQD